MSLILSYGMDMSRSRYITINDHPERCVLFVAIFNHAL